MVALASDAEEKGRKRTMRSKSNNKREKKRLASRSSVSGFNPAQLWLSIFILG
jgi:hypothetical protein